jgi:ankyrin repeat protein
MLSISPHGSSLANPELNPRRSDALDNLNLSMLINEYLENYDIDIISEEEEERLKSIPKENDIYFSYNSYLFWKNPSDQNLDDNILQTFKNFKISFLTFFNNDPEISLVLSNFDEESDFFQSLLRSTDTEGLIKMMQGLTRYLTKLTSLIIDDTEDKKQKVRESLLTFPSLPQYSEFVCLNGTRERIEQASSQLFSKNIFDITLQNIINEEIQKIFKDVRPGNQVHLFSCLLGSLTHSRDAIELRDREFSSPQSYIELREILTFIFESQQKLKQNLIKRIDELGDLYHKNVYQEIFDKDGEIDESRDYHEIWTKIINPFMEYLTPESSGIYSYDYSNLFRSSNQEFDSIELSELKTREQFVEHLKSHLFKTNQELFRQDCLDYSQHLIDPQKIFSGNEENGHYLNQFFLENLSNLFQPIAKEDSPEIKIIKKNKIYAGLMTLKLLNQDFSDSNPAYLFCFIVNFKIFHGISFQEFFYDSNLVLKEEYSQLGDLIESVPIEIARIKEEFNENMDILQFYSNLILYSPDNFKEVIDKYLQLSGNNFENYQFPNLLQFLVKTNRYDLVEKLIENSSDEFLLLLLQQSNQADSALKLAVRKNSLKMLSLLLDIDMTSNKKVIINSLFNQQDILFSALDEGKDKAFSLAIDKIKEYLLHNPEDKISIANLLEIKYFKNNLTALSFAVLSRNLQAIKELISIEADINSKDSNGDTPLINAIKSGEIEIVRALVNSGQSLEVSDANGYSPLFIASMNNPVMTEILLDGGATIESSENKASNLIVYLLSFGKTEIIEKFIKRGFNINESYGTNQKNEFIAKILGIDPQYMRFILRYGLDLAIQNAQDDRPYSLCEYLLDLDDYYQGDPMALQNLRETILENLKIIFLNQPQGIIGLNLWERIEEEKFKENAEYFIELANFIIENGKDGELKRFIEEFKNTIESEQKENLKTQTLIVKNCLSYLKFFNGISLPKLNELNLLEFQKSPATSLMKIELKLDFEDIFFTLKFIMAERKKMTYRDNDDFLDNFIRLLKQKEYKGLEVDERVMGFIKKLNPLKKEWIIDQISALKDNKIPPIIEFIESQNPNNLKYFSFFISNYLIDKNIIDDMSKFKFFEVLNLIDHKQLRALLTDPKYQNESRPIELGNVLTGKPDTIRELCCDILNRLKEQNSEKLSKISYDLNLSTRPYELKKMRSDQQRFQEI